jgi:methyltransferase
MNNQAGVIAWITALVFTTLNAALLRTRITLEDKALQSLTPSQPA